MSRSNTKVRLVVLPTNFRCQERSFEQNGDGLDIGLGLTPVKILKIVKIKNKQEIVFKKDKATLHVISKRCEETVNYSN